MAKYIVSKKAVTDLSLIWQYTFELWSEKQADRYYHEIVRAFASLAVNPSLGKHYSDVDIAIKGYRINKHIIFYTSTSKEEIFIIRILHERMDIMNQITKVST